MHCSECNQPSRHYALNRNLCVYHYCTMRGFNRCDDCDKNFKKLKTCYVCKQQALTREHHISYLPQVIINVCAGCHNKIHRGKLKQFMPNKRMMLIFYSKKNTLCVRVKNEGWKYRKLTELELAIKHDMKKSKVILE